MSKSKSQRPSRRRSLWRTAWRSLLVLGIGAVLLLVGAVAVTMTTLPGFTTLMKSPNGQAVRVVARDGTVLVNQGPSYGGWLRHEEIPDVMKGAMIAVEDRRFHSHFGVDPIGLVRALWVAAADGGNVRATSTITQQLARNLFLTNERTFARKGREALLALAMERRFSKEEILELYLNRVYFGGGAYGIDAASRRFYGHSAEELSAPEAAIIAGLVKAPSRFAPSSDPERARDRARVVALTMARDGVVPSAAALQADIEALEFAPQPKQNNVRYFTDWVLAQVDDLVSERVKPLVVTTTLDADMQRAAEEAVKTNAPEEAQGALVSMTPTGAVRAMMGGRDYVNSNYNRATVAERQPGSAWKLFVYLTAIENGISPRDYVEDAPVTIDGWTPRNYGRGHRGTVTVTQAFAGSYNTVAARLAERVGFNNVAMMARRLGIETDISRQPAMALGTSSVRLIEMTAAYAAVANGGRAVDPYGIQKVETADGRVLYERPADSTRVVLSPWVVTNMTYLLESVISSGTGRAAAFGKPAGGKTGTTSNYQDGYFVGFSRDLVTGVWMGRDDNRPVGRLTGGGNPARAFSAYMRRASEGMPARALDSDIGEDDDLFAEPDMEIYGEGWEEFGEYDRDYVYDPETGVGVTPDGDVEYGDSVEIRDVYPADPSARAELPSRMRSADVPTRPRADGNSGDPPRGGDGWLDEPVDSRRRPAPSTSQSPPAAENEDGPTSLLPPDPM
ncbi:penicillin-binding protein [Pacificimonas flava]|uniref:Penicillin-binding protein n=2 Tax=Pacificimonas TaxID=1960290 RepID=A0A219B3F8_9SPHN|nr:MULTISPECIES: PBP1A family penicillin-binding protein [Pacificimonas]MBZ6377649.1 PBP1A family penicillin-binding protein [Pacificimonas aurantium]OWV32666.1 penicillin-binding protein [Pacificimonas flava]